MATKTEAGKVKELAGGWITEREGTPIPLFLKLTYVGFSIFGLIYLFLYRAGEVTHDTRGPLVQEINKVMEVPGVGWMAFLAVILLGFVALLMYLAFSPHEDGE